MSARFRFEEVLRGERNPSHGVLSPWSVQTDSLTLICGNPHTRRIFDTGAFNPAFNSDPDFVQVVSKYSATPAQIAISWAVKRGTVAIPKSANVERMKQNITVRTMSAQRSLSRLIVYHQLIPLTDEDVKIIDSIHKKPRMHRNLLSAYFPDGVVFGWTYDQLGWNQDKDGFVVE